MATRQSEIITKGTLNVSLYVDLIQDNSGANPGDPLTALVFNSTGLVCYYIRPGALPVQITLVTQTVNGTHTDGGFVEVGSTMPGKYRLDIPDAVVAAGVDGAQVMVSGYVDLAPHTVNIQLTDVDLRDGQNAGLTVLPASGTLDVNPTLAGVTHTGAVIPTVSTVTDGAKDSTVAKDATVMKTTHINATSGVVNEVALVTGHTPQSGDSFPLASGVNGFANIKSDTASILADTELLGYAGPDGYGIYCDSAAANTNTAKGIDGTFNNPVSTLIAARVIADSIGANIYYIAEGSNFTLAAAHSNWEFYGFGEKTTDVINLGSQDVSGSKFINVTIEGDQGGAGRIQAVDCALQDPGAGTTTLNIFGVRCGIVDDITMDTSNDNVLIDSFSLVAGTTAPIIRASGAAGTIVINGHKGGVDLRGLSASHNITVNLAGGQVIFDASCNVNANVALRGVGTKTDNTAGMASINEIAFMNMDKVNAEADAALADYDGPTNAEMIARTRPTADYFDHTTDPVEIIATGGTAGGKAADELVDDFYDEPKADHKIGGTMGKVFNLFADAAGIESTVNDPSPTTTSIRTTLPNGVKYLGMNVVFLDGTANHGNARVVQSSSWDGTYTTLVFDSLEPFDLVPVNGENFLLSTLAGHTHTLSEMISAIDANSTQLAKIGTPSVDLSADIAAVNGVVSTLSDGVIKANATGGFHIQMIDASGDPAPSVAVTMTRRLDNGVFAPATGTASNTDANGVSYVAYTADDVNGTDAVAFKFSATGAKDAYIFAKLSV